MAYNMICPFCRKEMEKGILSGDGRSPVVWKKGNKRNSALDKIIGIGTVTASKRTLTSFTVESFFCRECQKMIFDTDVTK